MTPSRLKIWSLSIHNTFENLVYELGDLLFQSIHGREHYVSPAALRLAHKAVISLQRTSKEYSLFGKLALWSTKHCSKKSLVSSLCVETLVCYTRWVTVLSSPAVHWKQKLWQKSNTNEWNKQSAGVDMEMHYFLPFLAKFKCLRTAATQSQSSRPRKATERWLPGVS